MGPKYLVLVFVFLLIVEPIVGGQAQEQQVSWAGFREEVAKRRLTGRRVTVTLSDGGHFGSTLRRVEQESLVVESNASTGKRWRTVDPETRIPRAEVLGVRFLGRQGRGGLIGGLAGLGGSAAAVAADAKATEGKSESMEGLVVLFIPIAGVAGYLIGRHFDKPLPQYRILP